MTWLSNVERCAGERRFAGLHRGLEPRGEDDGLVDLAGNDYLGFSRHPDVLAAAAAALKGYGLGATASRLVRGSTQVLAELEAALAALLGCEAALVYSSGYLAGVGAIRGLAAAGVLSAGPATIASDAHNHACLVDGCRLSSAGRAGSRTLVYAHADPAALRRAVDAAADGASSGLLTVTESVFSVDGDLAPLAPLHATTRDHGGVLLVDEAHALGVLGPSGAAAVSGLAGDVDVVLVATLSKALGAAGGVVAGPRPFIQHLVETSRTFIYDTGLAPSLAAGALAAVGLVAGPAGELARRELASRAGVAVDRLRAAGLTVTEPAGGIICVVAPGPEHALAWAKACRERGVALGCFRPPSTPDRSSRLRLTINAALPRADFDRALDHIVACRP